MKSVTAVRQEKEKTPRSERHKCCVGAKLIFPGAWHSGDLFPTEQGVKGSILGSAVEFFSGGVLFHGTVFYAFPQF